MIDPSARIEAGAAIGQDVSIGPYCTIGPHVTLGDGCRLVGACQYQPATPRSGRAPSSIPFASLGSPPQSVQLSRRADAAGGRRRLRHPRKRHHEHRHRGRRRRHRRSATNAFSWSARHVGARLQGRQQCRLRQQCRCSAGHVSVGDNVVFGGGVAVRQFVRIGEGAMIVGLSGVRADVIPWGMAQGPLGRSGRPQRGRHAPARHFQGRHSSLCARAYQALFFGDGEFRARLDRVARRIRRRSRVVAR